MERERAERSGSRTSSSSDTDSDTVSEPDSCSNSEDTASEPEHLETRRCGALLAFTNTASLGQKGKQGGEQESENDSKEEKMRNKDDDEEEDEMVNSHPISMKQHTDVFKAFCPAFRCLQTVRTGVFPNTSKYLSESRCQKF